MDRSYIVLRELIIKALIFQSKQAKILVLGTTGLVTTKSDSSL
jgi:hypothetical protein